MMRMIWGHCLEEVTEANRLTTTIITSTIKTLRDDCQKGIPVKFKGGGMEIIPSLRNLGRTFFS
jgi:hypothetical protein